MAKAEYKSTVLEKYLTLGYLDLGNRMISAIDRLSAGKRLCVDFHVGKVSNTGVVDIAKIRVDGGASSEETARTLFHRDRYEKAMKSIPAEFWPMVRRVSIENEPLAASGSKLDVKRNLYAQRLDLCRGLDRLVKFYWHNSKKSA